MSVLADPSLESGLIDRIIPSRAHIPDDPAPGNYVVVDVTHFSTTVVELFANGAEYVHVPEEHGDEHAFKTANPAAKIGRERGPEYAAEGYDFRNSPGDVQNVEVRGRPTALTSTNGGTAVTDLRLASDDVTVYVAGRHLLGAPPSEAERAVYAEVVKLGKAPAYGSDDDRKARDLVEFGLRFDEREVVPRLDGQNLYDVSD